MNRDYLPVYVFFALAVVFNLGVWVGMNNEHICVSKTTEFYWR